MRRLAALTIVVALALPAGVALGTETAGYRDDFGTGAYSADDASLELSHSGFAIIDRVEVNGELESSTTTTSSTSSTTTTTRPDSSGYTPSTSAASPTSTSSPTTTAPNPPSTTSPGSDVATTTTSMAGSTTTTEALVVVAPPTAPPGSGMRDPGVGLMADYASGMMGDMGKDGVEVLGAELDADFSMAVEVVESAKLWVALLALVIGAAFVGSVDRRRHQKEVA